MLPDYVFNKLQCTHCFNPKLICEKDKYLCTNCGKKFESKDNVSNFIIFSNSSGQTIESKKGEIEFRELLVEQEILNKKVHFEGMPSDLDKLMQDWILPQIEDMEWIFNYLKIDKSKEILEIGSEYSYCTSYLFNHNYNSVGGDISETCLIKAPDVINKKLNLTKLPPLIAFDATNLPFQDASFDLIFSFAFVHHFENFEKLGKEIQRVLKKGGYFFFAWDPVIQFHTIYNWKTKHGGGVRDLHEEKFGIHEGIYNMLNYKRSFSNYFDIIYINPWKRWHTNSNVSGFKRKIKSYLSLVNGSDGIGMIMKRK